MSLPGSAGLSGRRVATRITVRVAVRLLGFEGFCKGLYELVRH